MQGDPSKTFTSTLPDLASTDAATPNLWDQRFRTLLDNDAGLNRRVADVESGARPARTVQTVDSVALLRAYLNPNPGEVAYVPSGGLYRYYPGATEAELLPWVVRPDSGAGRWRLDMVPRSLIGALGGVASLDGQGFLAQALPNGSVTSDKFAPGAVGTAALGQLTLNDGISLGTNTATLEQLLGAVGNRLKALSGKGSWRDAPAVTLETLNTVAARTDRTQTWTQRQTLNQVTVTGELIIPVV